MMKTQTVLPENYSKTFDIDLKENKKMATIVNVAAVVIGVVMVLVAMRFHSIGMLFEMSDGFGAYLARFVTVMVVSLAYIILHELVHGFFMKRFSGIKPKYGYTFVYAYAGSSAYFNKRDYIIIALSPIVIKISILFLATSSPTFSCNSCSNSPNSNISPKTATFLLALVLAIYSIAAFIES